MSSLSALMRNLSLSQVKVTLNLAPISAAPLVSSNSRVLAEQPRRSLTMRETRRIRGYPRPLVGNVRRPLPMKYGYQLLKPEQYTTDLIKIKKLGGRDPETGRVVVRTIGGGIRKWAHWVDLLRDGPEDGVYEEKIYKIEFDGLISGKVALVANGEKKRWIMATEGSKVGDIIQTTRHIPRNPVRPRDGDAHPLGALPIGTAVHCIEEFPREGAALCRAAGTHAEILRKVEGRVVIVLPSKLHVSLSEKCLAVVGQMSNADRMTTFYPLGSPNRLRRIGKRSRTGFWHRKDGYCGRKVRAPPPLKVIPLAKSQQNQDYVL